MTGKRRDTGRVSTSNVYSNTMNYSEKTNDRAFNMINIAISYWRVNARRFHFNSSMTA